MSGVIVLHLSFTATNNAYANDFYDAPQVKALAKGMPEDIAFFIARTAECNHWAGEEPYDKDRANYIRNAVEKAGSPLLDELTQGCFATRRLFLFFGCQG